MNKAFIFPGQASQFVGMAADLYEKYDLAKKHFEQANEIMEMDLKSICFNGPEEELKKTFLTQPAIFVHSCISAELLKEKGVKPVAVAGHSLGEYSALVAADALDFASGLELVKERSRLMFEAGQKNPGTMGAIIGLSNEQVNEICDGLKDVGVVQPANYNSPGQIAISGDKGTVLKALDAAKEMGSRKAVELVVSGAFHSPLMLDAQNGLAEALNKSEIKNIEIPLYTNVTAKPETDGEKIKQLLLKQLTSPVLWQDIVGQMVKDGNQNFIEVGPGKVLKGLLKRIDRDSSCDLCGTVDQLESIGA
ncbi:MAG: [acyl-carrier-protein] S-malonyltransferase [Calditrichaeota bacterium]|nr:MAG: [acyl-carrier-protein] S-malonyltransferase [Calditrichota bacterium]MBL1203779.1 [acyl-carrier-protein] S-malonyltransferase [Calditrichota bacterium]NOG43609.1 ACP S-malonyltransferase [Calditrichota bacterium]